MRFIDRDEEMARLERLAASDEGGLAVVYGRRRIGKTRLLLEWADRHEGLYWVADQSSAEIQRRYFAIALAARLPHFAEVEYRDWSALLARLAREAASAGWRGPIILDELPYLALSAGELPSVLQRWVDHEARHARLVVAVAGSSQRMMQGLVLSGSAPLFGRAREVFDVRPLDPVYLHDAFGKPAAARLVELYTAWGGVPRYWELAADVDGAVAAQVEELVLNPLGPLHREPDRLLLEELPPATEVRPILDAIGAGAHRVSEIAARVGRPATSMSRPLGRLIAMGLVRRELPFGESERTSRRSLYVIDDPFFRLWFRTVAPHRGLLAAATRRTRLALLGRHWESLAAGAWEDLCRQRLPRVRETTRVGACGPWSPALRWWAGNAPEWDVVSESVDGKSLLLGEVKWRGRPMAPQALDRARRELVAKPPPALPARYRSHRVVRALFVPETERPAPNQDKAPLVVTLADLLA